MITARASCPLESGRQISATEMTRPRGHSATHNFTFLNIPTPAQTLLYYTRTPHIGSRNFWLFASRALLGVSQICWMCSSNELLRRPSRFVQHCEAQPRLGGYRSVHCWMETPIVSVGFGFPPAYSGEAQGLRRSLARRFHGGLHLSQPLTVFL